MPQHVGTKIDAIPPDDRSGVRIGPNEREIFRIAQWRGDAVGTKPRREVERACNTILEADEDSISVEITCFDNLVQHTVTPAAGFASRARAASPDSNRP